MFPAASWHLLVVSADPHLHRSLVKFCEEALAHRETSASPLRIKVENAMTTLLPHGRARSDKIAATLGMSPRTLARKLSSEDVTVSEILRDLRSALAVRYLADPQLRISQVAWLLGYTEISSFTHAFQRWTGTTPSAMRARKQQLPIA